MSLRFFHCMGISKEILVLVVFHVKDGADCLVIDDVLSIPVSDPVVSALSDWNKTGSEAMESMAISTESVLNVFTGLLKVISSVKLFLICSLVVLLFTSNFSGFFLVGRNLTVTVSVMVCARLSVRVR